MSRITIRGETDAPSGYLAELGSIVHARWLVVLAVYLDESKLPEKIFTIAGYAFAPEGAQRFEKLWGRALASARPPLSRFHMSECESLKGPYAAWREPYKRAFLNRLASIIHGTARFQVAVAVDLEAFDVLAPSVQHILPGLDHYTLAVITVFSDLAKATGGAEPIAYVLDQIGKGKTNILEVFDFVIRERRWRPRPGYNLASSPIWTDSTLVPQLQAADMLAYESAKEAARVLRSSERPVREIGRRLVAGGGMTVPIGRVYTAEALQAYFERLREGWEPPE
jgi:hypothetical protein